MYINVFEDPVVDVRNTANVADIHFYTPDRQIAIESQKNNIRATSRRCSNIILLTFKLILLAESYHDNVVDCKILFQIPDQYKSFHHSWVLGLYMYASFDDLQDHKILNILSTFPILPNFHLLKY